MLAHATSALKKVPAIRKPDRRIKCPSSKGSRLLAEDIQYFFVLVTLTHKATSRETARRKVGPSQFFRPSYHETH